MQPPHFSWPGNKQYWCSDGNSGCCSWFSRVGVLNGDDVWTVSAAICFSAFLVEWGPWISFFSVAVSVFHNQVLILGMGVQPSTKWSLHTLSLSQGFHVVLPLFSHLNCPIHFSLSSPFLKTLENSKSR